MDDHLYMYLEEIYFLDIGSGLILALIGALIVMYEIDKYVYVSLFFVLFLVASPGASSAHLTVSEIFPSVIHIDKIRK